ncbi:MAG: hypothetical protein OXG06_00290 [Gammaproteobacteria bacterium]|nr:hypothetical protein [Gammaproteobacteria bacterium]
MTKPKATRKRARRSVKPEDPEQYKRFVETAKRLGCDDPKALDKVMDSEGIKPKPTGGGA